MLSRRAFRGTNLVFRVFQSIFSISSAGFTLEGFSPPWLLMGWLEKQLNRNEPWKLEKRVSRSQLTPGQSRLEDAAKLKVTGGLKTSTSKSEFGGTNLQTHHLRPIKFTQKLWMLTKEIKSENSDVQVLPWLHRTTQFTFLLKVCTKLRKCALLQRAPARNAAFSGASVKQLFFSCAVNEASEAENELLHVSLEYSIDVRGGNTEFSSLRDGPCTSAALSYQIPLDGSKISDQLHLLPRVKAIWIQS